MTRVSESSEEIAIVGMAGHFPGARDIEELWKNLCNGVESVSFFSAEELRSSGVDPAVLDDPTFVSAGAVMDHADCFDAAFFGYKPREAEIMDPQHRVFLECAWEALENAGVDPEVYPGAIGVFGGVGPNTYFQNNLAPHRELLDLVGSYNAMIGNEGHFPTTRVSYKLNLKGPSINVQTACSTSGVAIHLACQSLLSGECDVALAGGARIRVPLRGGYFYQADGIPSPDGHCRAFDARAQGTVYGSGVAILALKRLSDAIRDGDRIDAVIKGSAINNDGSLKAGFTAPSVQGQAAVIAEALAMAGVEAKTIGYVEAHGTGTALGDPIEVAALTRAYRESTDNKGFCAIGSIKTNIGHLDAGAGVTGVIKATLALKHKLIPPSINFEQPNPQIDFDNSPFYVNAALATWERGTTPRRAGVSSFGLGGTNVHIVLEEGPTPEASGDSRPWQLVLLSAKTPATLESATARLAEHLERHPDLHLADVAYTLQCGRRRLGQRRALVCRDVADTITALRTLDPKRVSMESNDASTRSVAFMFPGGGAQYVNMGQELYREELVFREQVDECLALLRLRASADLRSVLFPGDSEREDVVKQIEKPSVALPLLFTIEYALARLLMSWGVRPAAMIGHSMGEYSAACVAGVISLPDALSLVTVRGQLFDTLSNGAMLSVPLPEGDVRPFVDDRLSIAAVNGPSLCVVSGETQAIERIEKVLSARGIDSSRVHISVAAHSPMVEPILPEFQRFVETIKLQAPDIPYVSNVTGTWITATEATQPAYWVRHLRDTVRFADGLQVLLREPERILLEVGPGQTLSTYARRHPARSADQPVLSTLRHPQERTSDVAFLLNSVGRCWLAGTKIEWSGFHAREQRRRVALPTYPFERKRYWLDPRKPVAEPENAPPDGCPGSPEQRVPIRTALQDEVPMTDARPSSRKDRVLQILKDILRDLSGADPATLDTHATFLEMGFDSLFMTRASVAIQKKLSVKVTFRQFFEESPSLDALAGYVDAKLPADRLKEGIAAADYSPAGDVLTPAAPHATQTLPLPQAPAPPLNVARRDAAQPESGSSLERVVTLQLQVMAEQLRALRGVEPIEAVPPSEDATETGNLPTPRASSAPVPGERPTAEVTAFGPFRPVKKPQPGALNERQRTHLEAFIARYTRRTKGSKRLTAAQRPHLSDPRAVTGFNMNWKEIVYQIAMTRSAGSKMWDVDANEYVDLTMGFGVNLLGHSPAFVSETLKRQLEQGLEIGVLSPLAGQVADLICELTGMERVSFLNTGSEANMAALRAARTVTGREKIAVFSGSYHGIFDEVLVTTVTLNGRQRSIPIAPGIPNRMVEDVMVLDYGDPRSLDVLQAHAGDLAAVFVEPIQSRHPDLQPRDFLQALREITRAAGTALVFDEVITGFRLHPKGAQGRYGVQADIATYGKLIGGGLPMAVVAGTAVYMDAFDGGTWNYGDNSFPEARVTFFGGTFVKHPLALAAAHAVLTHLKVSGPQLQHGLNDRSSRLVGALNDHFTRAQVAIRIEHCGSMLFFTFPDNNDLARLIFYYLREKGVHIWDRPAFLSTAHTDEDLAFIIQAVKDSVAEMQDAGFLSAPAREPDGASRRTTSPATALSSTSPASVTEQPAPDEVMPPRLAEVPLTDSQMELWLAHLMGDEASCSFLTSYSVHLRGVLRLEALRKALQQVVDRHEALRGSFSPTGEFMRFAPVLTLEIPLVDLSVLSEDDRRRHVEDALARDVRTPFDLVSGPLVRAQVLKLAAEHHLLLLAAHHIAFDGFSSAVLMRELATLYSSACQGTVASLPRAMQFSEYARWQHEQKTTADYAAAEDYWLEQCSAPPPALELPADRPRPSTKTFNSGEQRWTIDRSLTTDLKRFGARHGCTLFATLLAAYQVLLYRLSYQNDMIVGVPTSGQAVVEGDDLVGHCVNFHALRSRLDADQTFSDYLRYVRGIVLDAHEHRNYTFGSLLAKLKLPRDPSRWPLLSVQINLEPEKSRPPFHGLDVEVSFNRRAFYSLDFGLDVSESGGELKIRCDYNVDLFESATIHRWLGHFETLLKAIVENPGQRISDLPLLTAAERHQILVEWNDTAMHYPRDRCIHELFEAQVERTPHSVAVEYEGRQLTYGELNVRANQLAHYLARHGVGPEVMVGVCMERSLDMVVGILAILKAGGAYVPLDPDYPAPRLTFMLDDTAAPVLLMQARLRGRVPGYRGRMVALDADWPEIARERQDDPNVRVSARSLAYVIYTSGSTGRPKGTCIEHRSVVRLVKSTNYVDLGPQEVFLQFAPISFDASTLELWASLLNGAKLVVCPAGLLSLQELGRVIQEGGVTTLWLAAALFHQMVDEQIEGLQGVRQLLAGGETLSVPHVRRMLKAIGNGRLINGYGPTENTTFTCCHVMTADSRIEQTVPIGRPISNTRVYILDGHMRPVPIGVYGELYIAGDGLARGYLHQPELTAEKFVADPFSRESGARLYRSGDLVRFRADGCIEILGRIDQQVKIRGFRIEPGEVEAGIAQHPAIREVAVIAREDVPGDKRLVAYLVARENVVPSVSELRAVLRSKLPEYMIPSSFVVLEALPLTPNGKVNRRALPIPDQTRLQPEGSFVAPRTRVEEILVRIWAEVLRCDQVGIHDNFFELGGDSILGVQIIAKANREGFRLNLTQLFQHQTIAELAAVAGTAQPLQVEQKAVTGPLPLTPIQHWLFEQDPPEPHHWNMTMLLEARQPLDPTHLAGAVQHLLLHHDALRLRLVRENSAWYQTNAGPDGIVPFAHIDLSTLSESEQGSALESEVASIQASLNLADGPLVRVALFDFGAHKRSRLLLVIHHLAVDGVSLRILLEDLQTIYLQLSRGEAVNIPPKTSSFKQWAYGLVEYAQSTAILNELAYWLAVPGGHVSRLPADYPGGANTEASARRVSVSLSATETEALLQEVPATYRSQINEVLLTALALAFRRNGALSLLIDLEGHGREQIVDHVDLSRTVGWFTTVFPVLLDLKGRTDSSEALNVIREGLHRIPNRGIGYGLLRYLSGNAEVVERLRTLPQAEVCFNYLGQFDHVLPESSPFGILAEPTGPHRNLRGTRRYLLEVDGRILGGRLQLVWTYSENVHRRETIERLAQGFLDALCSLIADCQFSATAGDSISDFPMAELSKEELDALIAEPGASEEAR